MAISARDHVEHLAGIDAETFVRRFRGDMLTGRQQWISRAWVAVIEDADLNAAEAIALRDFYVATLLDAADEILTESR